MLNPLSLLRRQQSKWLVVFLGLFPFRPIFFGDKTVNYLGQDNSWRLYRGLLTFFTFFTKSCDFQAQIFEISPDFEHAWNFRACMIARKLQAWLAPSSRKSPPMSAVPQRRAFVVHDNIMAMTTSSVTASTASKLANSRLEVTTSTLLGRGLMVTQGVPAGSLLVRLDPLISVLDDSLLDKACSTCFSMSKSVDESIGKELLKCTGCNFVHYCSKVTSFLRLCWL